MHSVQTQTTPSTSTSTSRTRSKSRDFLDCPVCYQTLHKDQFPVMSTCSHRSCRQCLKQYLRIEITESRVNIACPECAARFHPNEIR